MMQSLRLKRLIQTTTTKTSTVKKMIQTAKMKLQEKSQTLFRIKMTIRRMIRMTRINTIKETMKWPFKIMIKKTRMRWKALKTKSHLT